MKSFWQRLVSNVVFGAKFALGGYALYWIARFFDTTTWQTVVDWASVTLPFAGYLETAVIVAGGFFLLTWGVRFLDRIWFRGRLEKGSGLVPRQSSLKDFWTSPLIHEDDTHLIGNTGKLMLFSAIAVLLTMNAQTFIVATIAIFLGSSAGMWVFGRKGRHMGASGIVLGYFSFDVVYGLVVVRDWRAVVSLVLALWFGRWAYRQLTFRGGNVSYEGHLWGFMSGILAAAVLYYLGV